MAKVLVVDDDINITKLMEIKLGSNGHEVCSCRSAKEALQRAKQFMPDMVLLDVMLRDGTGYSVARRIRMDPELYRVGILFQSVADEERDVEYALEQGGDEYLIKPYSLKRLLEKMEQLERLSFSVEQRCPITNLPGLVALRREVDKALFRNEPFALCYLFMKGLRAYKLEYGSRAEDKIGFFTSKVIHEVMRNSSIFGSFTAHLGGGYFMTKLDMEDYKKFRENVRSHFHEHVKELRAMGVAPFRHGTGYGSKPGEKASTELLVAVTHTDRKRFRNAHEMFETLRQSEKVANSYDRKVRSGLRREKLKAGHEHWMD